VAPHLVLQLRVGDRRHWRVLVEAVAVLGKLGREVAQVLLHLADNGFHQKRWLCNLTVRS
jgi:hypothetical protein